MASEFERKFTPTPETPIPDGHFGIPELRYQVDEVAWALMLSMRWGNFDSIDYSVIKRASKYVEGWQYTLREESKSEAT